MNYLSRIAKYLSGILSGEESGTNSKSSFMDTNVHRTDGDNLIEKKDNIMKSIVESLKMFKGNDTSASRLCLTIYILDDIIFSGLGLGNADDSFKNSLRDKIMTELGVIFKDISISKEQSDDKETLKGTGINYLFFTLREETKSCASITALKGHGSLIGDVVKLYPKHNQVYLIGIGKQVETSNGVLRINNIAIDDNIKCQELENNKFVSRDHAHIQYKKSVGFVLYVDEGGTPLKGKRTRVQRQGKVIDLGSDTNNGVPLMSGDIIELGKHVWLEFNYA